MRSLRSVVSLLFWSVVAFTIYAAVYLPAQQNQAMLHGELETLHEDIAGLKARLTNFGRIGSKAEFPAELLWPSADHEDAELALQDAIVDLAVQTGVSLITFGVSGLTRDVTQSTIAFEFEAEAQLEQVYALLHELENLEPKVAVGLIRMRPTKNYGMEPVDGIFVYSQIVVWAFKEDKS